MPIYEYTCESCGAVTEVITKMGDTGQDVSCDSCGGTSLKKKLSVTTIPSFPSPRGGKTCCGRDEKCGGGGSCCGM